MRNGTMARLLIHGDPHYEVSSKAASNVDIADVHMQLAELAFDQEVDAVINLGDTCDNNHPRPQTIASIISVNLLLAEEGVISINLVGNHDISTKHSHALTPLVGLHENVVVVEKPSLLSVCECDIIVLPYITRQQVVKWTMRRSARIMQGRTGSDKQTIRKALSRLHNPQAYLDAKAQKLIDKTTEGVLAVGHLDIHGARAGSEEMMLRGGKLNLPDCIRNSDKPVAYVGGHIHQPQIIRTKPWPIVTVGSLIHTDFSERHETKGVIILELDDV